MKPLIPAVLATVAAVTAASLFTASSASAHQPDTTEQTETQTAPEEIAYVYAEMKTSKGTMYIALNETKAPISTKNFVDYANEDYYDGTVFHRVIKGFMAQGGGFTLTEDNDLEKKPTKDSIKNEWKNGLSNTRGTLAMARLGRQPDSATSQFFINLVDNPFLDQPRDGAGYAVFGRVVKGLDVLDAIGNAETSIQGVYADVPTDPIVIESVTILTDAQVKDLELAAD